MATCGPSDLDKVQTGTLNSCDFLQALVQEIVRTIRDIIQLNPLYRESVQSVIMTGERVVEDPVYLCDLGAAITGSDNNEFQSVLEEPNVSP